MQLTTRLHFSVIWCHLLLTTRTWNLASINIIVQYRSFITSHLHMCPCVVSRRISCGKKISMKQDVASRMAFTRDKTYYVRTMHARLATHRQFMRDLSYVYNPHENPREWLLTWQAGRWIVANYVVLSVTLHFAGMGMPNKYDGKYAASNWREGPIKLFWHQHCIVIIKRHFNNISIT